MILVSYQKPEVYEGILAGSYRPKLSKSYASSDMRDMRAYEWLLDQMRLRVGPEPAGVTTPYWAWLFRENAPLEVYDAAWAGYMRLTLNIADSRVLVSSHDDWHCVLNDSPVLLLTECEQDDEAVSALWDKYYPTRRATWPRIFDMENYPDTWAFQATFWELFPDDIVGVTEV